MFGLTGGLMPCPASVTILMICLHLKRFTLGAAMVASFSIGLAISLVSVGVIAAWGAHQVSKRGGNLSNLARKMPYLSSVLMMVGAVMGIQGLLHHSLRPAKHLDFMNRPCAGFFMPRHMVLSAGNDRCRLLPNFEISFT
jgi:sulfite exporter TauE/SafE